MRGSTSRNSTARGYLYGATVAFTKSCSVFTIAAFIRTGNPNNPALGVTWDQWTPTAPRRLVFDANLQQAAISVE